MSQFDEEIDGMEVLCITCGDWVDSIGAEEGDECSHCLEQGEE